MGALSKRSASQSDVRGEERDGSERLDSLKIFDEHVPGRHSFGCDGEQKLRDAAEGSASAVATFATERTVTVAGRPSGTKATRILECYLLSQQLWERD